MWHCTGRRVWLKVTVNALYESSIVRRNVQMVTEGLSFGFTHSVKAIPSVNRNAAATIKT